MKKNYFFSDDDLTNDGLLNKNTNGINRKIPLQSRLQGKLN